MSRRRQNADEAREPAASDATKLRDVIKWNMRIGPVVYLLFAASNYFLNYAPRMAGVSLTAAILALLILVLHRQFINRLTANLLICTIAIQVFGEMFVNGGLSAPIAPLVMVIVPAAVIMASPRVAVLWSVFVTIGLAAMALLQAGDLLPPEELSGHARIADQALSIVMGVILIAFVSSIFARQSRMAMRTLAIERYRYQYEASHDSLTGLPNRSHFYEHAEQLLIKARDSGGVFTLLYLDLDGFKKVNDTLGHAAGDHLLIDFADQARQQFDDDCFIARLAGDEFVILGPAVASLDQTDEFTSRASALLAPIETMGRNMPVSVSIGAATYPADGEDIDAMLRIADRNMYRAKRLRKQQHQLGVANAATPTAAHSPGRPVDVANHSIR